MTPEAWGLVSAGGLALIGILAAYLRKRLGLSDEAGEAVKAAAHAEEKPGDYSQAFYLLAHRLEVLDRRDEAWSFYTLHLELWGTSANERLPVSKRRPMPERPAILRSEEPE